MLFSVKVATINLMVQSVLICSPISIRSETWPMLTYKIWSLPGPRPRNGGQSAQRSNRPCSLPPRPWVPRTVNIRQRPWSSSIDLCVSKVSESRHCKISGAGFVDPMS